jgi:membrane protein DedA with SNARE-associated domain
MTGAATASEPTARHSRTSRGSPRGTSIPPLGVEDRVTGAVESLGYVGVVLLMALENIFPPIPSEVIMPLTGHSASQGKLNLWLALFGAFGILVGTLPWYGLASWLDKDQVYGWVERHGHWLTVERRELERAPPKASAPRAQTPW